MYTVCMSIHLCYIHTWVPRSRYNSYICSARPALDGELHRGRSVDLPTISYSWVRSRWWFAQSLQQGQLCLVFPYTSLSILLNCCPDLNVAGTDQFTPPGSTKQPACPLGGTQPAAQVCLLPDPPGPQRQPPQQSPLLHPPHPAPPTPPSHPGWTDAGW